MRPHPTCFLCNFSRRTHGCDTKLRHKFEPDVLDPDAVVRDVELVEDVRIITRLQNSVNVQQALEQSASSCKQPCDTHDPVFVTFPSRCSHEHGMDSVLFKPHSFWFVFLHGCWLSHSQSTLVCDDEKSMEV